MSGNRTLSSQGDVEDAAAALFRDSSTCEISVREETAFGKPAFFSLGEINLFPLDDTAAAYAQAVRQGAFEWITPDIQAATTSLSESLGLAALAQPARAKAEDKVRRLLDSMGAIPARLGLDNPIFDPRALEGMPYKRPTTIIADTSGVIQGGLSFVARNLFPAVRIKVPAVVQMEIVNFADRFLSNRRADKPKSTDLVIDHLMSQAGQRVLLQLELHSDVELERTFLLGDPLRGAFQRDEDKELKELNMNASIRAYADRLILEAARQHQSQVSFGHPVMLLTADQGLARMAMAEGLEPVYFRSAKASALFGRRLTGTNFHPFSGAVSTTSLSAVLWELATNFGCCRIKRKKDDYEILVHAIGKDLAWAPYHSHDDLLWIEPNLPPVPALPKAKSSDLTPVPAVPKPESSNSIKGKTPASSSPSDASSEKSMPPTRARSKPISGRSAAQYKFSVDKLVRLVDILESDQELAEADVLDVLEVKTVAAADDYRRFLESGNAIQTRDHTWFANPPLTTLATAVRSEESEAVRAALRVFPSFKSLEEQILLLAVGQPFPTQTLGRASATYQVLAEISGLAANVYGQGLFATPSHPREIEFSAAALRNFEKIADENGWASTGKWLEELVINEGIHPLVARSTLQSASERKLIKRVTEGSTTDTKFDRHILRILGKSGGFSEIKTVHLYRGDFLIPGKSSSTLRIEGVKYEPA